jgi:hypothetical protein
MARHCKLPSILGDAWPGEKPNVIYVEKTLEQIKRQLAKYGNPNDVKVQDALKDLDFMIKRIDT